jgi:hypothetical protein
LEVGDLAAVEMGDLVPAEGLMVADILEVYLDDLEGLGRVPVHEGPDGARPAAAEGWGDQGTIAPRIWRIVVQGTARASYLARYRDRRFGPRWVWFRRAMTRSSLPRGV